MSETQNGNGSRRTTLNVELWHVLLVIVVLIAGIAATWGRFEQGQADQARRITALEQSPKPISRDEFEDWRNELSGRLANIESQLAHIRQGN